jgi:hypothetical protein
MGATWGTVSRVIAHKEAVIEQNKTRKIRGKPANPWSHPQQNNLRMSDLTPEEQKQIKEHADVVKYI